MKSRKIYIVLITILFVFFIVMFLLFGVKNIKQNRYSSTIIVGENTAWIYDRMKWTNVKSDISKQKLSWREYNVFSNGKSIGKYNLWHDDKWYVFDSDKKAIDIEGKLLAYNANYNIDVLSIEEKEVENSYYIEKVFRENDISLSSNYTSLSMIEFDFDKDGNIEEFYLVTNAFPMDFNPETIFSIVFMVKNDNIYYYIKILLRILVLMDVNLIGIQFWMLIMMVFMN